MRRNLGVRNVGVIDLIYLLVLFNIKVCMLIKFWICNLCQERFSINHLRLFLEVHRVIHVHVYMYTSRV